jgi:Domain of unknown function (DUF397)
VDITDWRTSSLSYNGSSYVEVGSWRKSSHSTGGNCVEAGNYRSSSACDGGACVEAASCTCGVAVRDTVLAPSSPVLIFDAPTWARFLASLKADA